MKSAFYAAAILFAFAFPTCAKADWIQENHGTGGYFPANNLNSFLFTSDSVGYAVGDSGVILKTFDAGATWSARNSGTKTWLWSVSFPTADTGYIVGYSGQILKTTDSGNSWVSLNSNSITGFYNVFFTSADTGFVSGELGTILRTTDGGESWDSSFIGQTGNNGSISAFSSMYFVNPNVGFNAGENGEIYKTKNAGANWTALNSNTLTHLTGICFPTLDTGYAVGLGGVIIRSTDSGNTWAEQTSGTNADLLGVHFYDALYGAAVGVNGTLLRTTNGGSNWNNVATGTSLNLLSVHFIDSKNGMAVGGQHFTENAAIFKTVDSGATWNSIGRNYSWFRSVSFPNHRIGFAVGDAGASFKSVDSGVTWSPLPTQTQADLHAIVMLDTNTGFAAGDSGTLLKTTDGQTWAPLNSSSISSPYSALAFLNSSVGFVAGFQGAISKTTTSGLNWVSTNSGAHGTLRGLSFPSATIGYAVGDGGTILTSNDGGDTWSPESSGTSLDLHAVYFTDSLTGYAAGQQGVLLKTKDAGAHWLHQTSGTTLDLNAIYFPTSKVGYAVGGDTNTVCLPPCFVSAQNVILKTVSSGNNWFTQTVPTPEVLNGVFFLDSNSGFAVGRDGTVLKTSDGGGPVPALDAVVAHWDFEEGQGTFLLDKSGNNHNGDITGATWAPGAFGTGLYFNGNGDMVTIPFAPDLNLSEFTLTAWVKSLKTTEEQSILSRQPADDSAWNYRLFITGADSEIPSGRAAFDERSKGATRSSITSQAKVADGNWHFIAATRKGSKLFIYVDGSFSDSVNTEDSSVIQSEEPITLGASLNSGNPYYFEGVMDEVSIYSKALSLSEINALYPRSAAIFSKTANLPLELRIERLSERSLRLEGLGEQSAQVDFLDLMGRRVLEIKNYRENNTINLPAYSQGTTIILSVQSGSDIRRMILPPQF